MPSPTMLETMKPWPIYLVRFIILMLKWTYTITLENWSVGSLFRILLNDIDAMIYDILV